MDCQWVELSVLVRNIMVQIFMKIAVLVLLTMQFYWNTFFWQWYVPKVKCIVKGACGNDNRKCFALELRAQQKQKGTIKTFKTAKK